MVYIQSVAAGRLCGAARRKDWTAVTRASSLAMAGRPAEQGLGRGGPSAGWHRRLLGILSGQRLRPLLVAALLAWGLFGVFRAGLLLVSHEALADVGAAEIARCLWIGTWFDAVPIGYALLPLVLILSLAPNRAFRRRSFRRLVVAYVVTLVTLVVGVEVIGAAFFLHFGVRLNWIAIDYLRFREAAAYIWKNYPVALLVFATSAVFYVCHRLCRKAFWAGPRPRVAFGVRAVLTVVLTGLCLLACRGSFRPEPLDQGSAYSCENNIVNQLTMNNVFTFAQAVKSHLVDSRDMAELYPLPEVSAAAGVAAEMLFQPGDAPAGHEANPLWRRCRAPAAAKDYNVVMIIMEGMAGEPVGALGNSPSHTPFLDGLCRQGLFFQRMYAAGERTSRGLVATLCGHPDLGRLSVLRRPRAQGRFLTLPQLFRQRDYRTLFVYGGDPDFDMMRQFFSAGGIQTFIGQEQMRAGTLVGHWGAHDEVIFRRAHETFEALGRQKFFAVVLTVSNHTPFDVPAGRCEMLPDDDEDNRRLNAYRYADWALGEFFRRASRAEYFRRTIFVLVADHGRQLDPRRILDVSGHRVPCLIYAPGIVPARRVATVCGQADIPPTLLALLGGQHEHCFFGRNLLAVTPGDGFALLNEDDRIGFVHGDQALVLPPKHGAILFRMNGAEMAKVEDDPAGARRLQRQMLSLFVMARHLYLSSAYRPPPEPVAHAAAPR